MNTEYKRAMLHIILGILLAFVVIECVDLYIDYREALILDKCGKVSRRIV